MVTQLKYRLAEGQGAATYYLGVEDSGFPLGLGPAELASSLETLGRMARALEPSLGGVLEIGAAEERPGLLGRIAVVDVRARPHATEPTEATAARTSPLGLSVQKLGAGGLEAELQACGEALVEVGRRGGAWGPDGGLYDEKRLAAALRGLEEASRMLGASCRVLESREEPLGDEDKEGPEASPGAPRTLSADVLVRLKCAERPIEVRIASIGNVDAGKSTLVGVLTQGCLDDGRGRARRKIFKHPHENDSGRTSAVAQHSLCMGLGRDTLDRNGGGGHRRVVPGGTSGGASSSKIVTFIDLAGHEKYFKTTAFGLTALSPDYAGIVVGANHGIVGMCKEHLSVALALKIPAFFVVTKVDLAPKHVLKENLAGLVRLLQNKRGGRKPVAVKTLRDVIHCARHISERQIAPVFLTSCVTGQGLSLLRSFMELLPQRAGWDEAAQEPVVFVVDDTSSVPGVGTVVSGTLKKGVVRSGQRLLLGPAPADGSFNLATVRSIHYKRDPVDLVAAGQTAALALKKVSRSQVRPGMVLVHESVEPKATWEFEADIAILAHSTLIQPRYQAVIHCEAVRAPATVLSMSKGHLRSGDRARVRFRFLKRPEYLVPSTRFLFREGKTRGVGLIVAAT